MSFVRPTIKTVSRTSADLAWYLPRGLTISQHYTPCFFEVQWLHPTGEWVPWVSEVRKTRVTLTDLDPGKDYVFRVLPANDYGVGLVSQSVSKFGRRKSMILGVIFIRNRLSC